MFLIDVVVSIVVACAHDSAYVVATVDIANVVAAAFVADVANDDASTVVVDALVAAIAIGTPTAAIVLVFFSSASFAFYVA
jgi:hypothetical protein